MCSLFANFIDLEAEMASDSISNTLKSKNFAWGGGGGGMPPDHPRTWELCSHFAFVRNSILGPPSSFTLKSPLYVGSCDASWQLCPSMLNSELSP